MAIHSSVLAWRIPGTGEPGGLPSMGSHKVGHDWSDLAAAAGIILIEIFGPVVLICCSVTQSCLTMCDPIECNTPGFPVFHHLPEFAQTLIHWVNDTIQSYPLALPSPPVFSLSQHQGLPKSQLFTSGDPSNRASAWASVLPGKIQGGFPLVLTSFISLMSKALSRVFSNTKVSILCCSVFFLIQLLHLYVTTGKP